MQISGALALNLWVSVFVTGALYAIVTHNINPTAFWIFTRPNISVMPVTQDHYYRNIVNPNADDMMNVQRK